MIDEEYLRDVGEIYPVKKTVQYYVRLPDDEFADPQTVEECTRRPIRKSSTRTQEAAINVEEQIWCMWTKYLGHIIPKEGDKFSVDGIVFWYIQPGGAGDLELAGARYVLTCRKGRVVA